MDDDVMAVGGQAPADRGADAAAAAGDEGAFHEISFLADFSG
jgi:hypothetical protein